MNGIVQVKPKVSFLILIANYSEKSYYLQKRQILAHLVPQKSGARQTYIILREILGITEADEGI